MKALLIASVLVTATAASANPVEEMTAQGFACNPAGKAQVICRKDGAPTKVCNSEGSCFRIVYENGKLSSDNISTGSIYGGVRRSQSTDISEY